MSTKYVDSLKSLVSKYVCLGVVATCNYVLADPRFYTCPGGKTRHHKEIGGLARHTYEVVEFAMIAAEAVPHVPGVLLTAAIWHDYGKIWDYRYGLEGETQKTEHYTLVRHIVRSYSEFMAQSTKINPVVRDQVGHCILAHHGRREWGSPVEPQTIEALLLHQADMLSMTADVKRGAGI